MNKDPEVIKCNCPCHKGGVPPHDEFLCPQCGQWLMEAKVLDKNTQ